MFAVYFVDGPLRGRHSALDDASFYRGHGWTVLVAPDYFGPIPWPEPSVSKRAEKPWEPSTRTYWYRFRRLTVLGRTVILGWCAKELPDEAALFDALINPNVRSAVALQEQFSTPPTGDPHDDPISHEVPC